MIPAAVGLSLTTACGPGDREQCTADETIVGEWKLRAEHSTNGDVESFPKSDPVEHPVNEGQYCDSTYGMRMVTMADDTATLTFYFNYGCEDLPNFEVDYFGTFTGDGSGSYAFEFPQGDFYDGDCTHEGHTLECKVPSSDFIELRVFKKC
jgi:hypothetical protein